MDETNIEQAADAIAIRVGLISLGCPKNQVDSEVMLGGLRDKGFRLEPRPEAADVVIINTCGFVDTAKQESIDTILQYGRLKKQGRCRVLIASGCLAQRYPDELMKSLPELDAVVGTGDFPRIAEICGRLMEKPAPSASGRNRRQFLDSPPYLYQAESPRIRISPRHWAYVKISEGCNYRCSFCAIPNFRGDLVSRQEGDITEEVRRLAGEGVREINLIAQSLTSYGWDRRDRGALNRLLDGLSAVDGIEWIRLYYTYPTDLTDDLLDRMAADPKICSYVDIPLQHIHDEILKRMNRKGDARLIRDLLGRIRSRVPGVAVRSTFIVGFPGETDSAFEALCGFVEETRFDRIGVFTYSHEEGTSAYSLIDDVPARVKTERQSALLNLQADISLEKNRERVGSVQRVLVDGYDAETGELEGRLEGQAPEIDGVVILEGDSKPGEFVRVEITDATEIDLIGRIVS
jgi:ribosomal protein S12 methylthiotransferase